jgi:hypothetical protein
MSGIKVHFGRGAGRLNERGLNKKMGDRQDPHHQGQASVPAVNGSK